MSNQLIDGNKKDKKNAGVMRNMSLMATALYILTTAVIAIYSSSSSALSENEKQSLIYLVKQDCGSCHGLTLQGGIGPALLKKNLKNKPLKYIETVIANGRTGTPMPPWKEILGKEQIRYIANYLLSDHNTLANQPPNIHFEKISQSVKK